jgi:hypothetical protein
MGWGACMTLFRRIAAAGALMLCLSLALTACARPPKADPALEAQSRARYGAVIKDDVAAAQGQVAPDTRRQLDATRVANLRHYLPAGEPLHVKTVDSRFATEADGTVVNRIETEYEYPQNFVLLETDFARKPGAAPQMITFRMQAATREEVDENHFSFKDAVVVKSVVAGLGLLELIIILAAVGEILYSRPKGWPFWLLSSLFGFGQISFNWATHAFSLSLLSISFLGAGIHVGSSAFAPWAFSLSIPIFAIVSLSQAGASIEHRRRLRSREKWQAEAAEQEKTRDPNEL